jgi:hypothetical protein
MERVLESERFEVLVEGSRGRFFVTMALILVFLAGK